MAVTGLELNLLTPPNIPEGQGCTLTVSNFMLADVISINIWLDDATLIPTTDIGTLTPDQIKTVSISWEKLKDTSKNVKHTFTARGTRPVPPFPEVVSSAVAFMITSLPAMAKVVFVSKEDVPYYPAHMVLLFKETGKYWEYENDRDGTFHIPRRLADIQGTWELMMSYHDVKAGKIAEAVIDNYDFSDITVKAGLTDRNIILIRVNPANFEDFFKGVKQLMPAPLGVVVDVLAGVAGWVSDAVSHIIALFLASYLNVKTGGNVIGVEWNKEEGTYDVTAVSVARSPLVWTAPLVIAVLAFLAIIFISITVMVTSYTDAEVERHKTEREKQYTGALESVTKLREEGKISEETYKSAVEALTHATDVISASTPSPTWMAYVPAIIIVVIMAVIGIAVIWYATRRAPA